jgi:osmotically-inducible protein OsmY
MGRLFKLLLAAGAVAAAVFAARTSRGRHALNKAQGAAAAAMPKPPGSRSASDLDDVSLARKVETEIFRAPDAPKGDVSVDVQEGIAYLRGEVSDEAWIERFADEAAKVDGIRGVENLLHAPTPR